METRLEHSKVMYNLLVKSLRRGKSGWECCLGGATEGDSWTVKLDEAEGHLEEQASSLRQGAINGSFLSSMCFDEKRDEEVDDQ
jgi:hypothetical protein